MTFFRSSVQRVFCAISFVAILSSCGPDLLKPADSSVTGSWVLTGLIPNLSEIKVEMDQKANGVIEGNWSGVAGRAFAGCLMEACPVSGPVKGLNSVLQVYIEIIGAGDFTGQLVTPTRLRGSIATPDPIAVELTR